MPEVSLAIDKILPELSKTLAGAQALILQAPPGTGKTTRVPPALLAAPWLQGKSILMLEPRRLAASNAANFMAAQRGEKVGQTIGYSIRYQRKVSSRTRIEVVTEGILTRRLQHDPELTGVGLVIFDEFHERHLQSDLALALCRDIQLNLRDDLKLLVMSATLDSEPLAQLLKAPILTCSGKSFPVDIHYLPSLFQPHQLVEVVVRATHRALRETSGDILVFLPGEAEIKRTSQQLNQLSDQHLICPLYGSLPFREQQRAIQPGERRKIVLATNIAETSLTIEGVTVVIDSGYCRQPRFDSAAGLTRLELSRISQASSLQRTGRAGRLGPGTCYRLWSEGAQGALLPFTPAEIRSADLAPLTLELLHWGSKDPAQLSWLDPPPASAWSAGLELLNTLGALTAQGLLSDRGKALAELPCHPRIGCLLQSAERQQLLPLGCDLAALLGERDPWGTKDRSDQQSECDLFDRLEELWKRQRRNQCGEFSAIDRACKYWRRYFKLDGQPPLLGAYSADQIACLLAAAFPDRIAQARNTGSSQYLLSTGQGASLDERSAVKKAQYLIAVELRTAKTAAHRITLASRLNEASIRQLHPDLPWRKHCHWDASEGRLISCARQMLGEIILAERVEKATAEERTQAILAAIRTEGWQLLNWAAETESFSNRIDFLRRHQPDADWPDCSRAGLLDQLDSWLPPFLGNSKNRGDLKKIDLLAALRTRLDWRQQQQLEQLAPERLQVPSGAKIRLQYPSEGPPVLAVKLQEMFGQQQTPRILNGQVPVLIHLLSPAGRPLQVTQDLKNFWAENYLEVKKEMKGRYPKHPWPDDPLMAIPTAKTKRRS